MTYEHRCPKCNHVFDVVKSVRQIDDPEFCPVKGCEALAPRIFALPRRLYLSHTAVQEAEYNPGLGCITKSRQHVKEICRQRGLEEIGNEKPETLHKHFDRVRADKREAAWAQADKGWVGAE